MASLEFSVIHLFLRCRLRVSVLSDAFVWVDRVWSASSSANPPASGNLRRCKARRCFRPIRRRRSVRREIRSGTCFGKLAADAGDRKKIELKLQIKLQTMQKMLQKMQTLLQKLPAQAEDEHARGAGRQAKSIAPLPSSRSPRDERSPGTNGKCLLLVVCCLLLLAGVSVAVGWCFCCCLVGCFSEFF